MHEYWLLRVTACLPIAKIILHKFYTNFIKILKRSIRNKLKSTNLALNTKLKKFFNSVSADLYRKIIHTWVTSSIGYLAQKPK